MPSIHEMIRERRAIRRYEDRPVPTPLLHRLLESATWAPSAHNRQPWRFAVLTAFAAKERLAQAMGARLRQDRLADGDPPEAIEQDVTRSYNRITSAPVLIIVCLSMADMDQYPDERRRHNEWVMATQSTAMAAQNLWLAAHAEGLGACWLCAPLFVPDLVRATMGLPDDWEPQGLLTLGYPAETRTKSRAPWQEKVLFL
ncbi:MAG: nitroreductase family protein [Anaerolineales bacterium]|nr:nitroreductase family protein [Anaerolineales bacterium]